MFTHLSSHLLYFFFFQAEDGIRDHCVTGVQTCALPISLNLLSPRGPRTLSQVVSSPRGDGQGRHLQAVERGLMAESRSKTRRGARCSRASERISRGRGVG